MAVLDEIERLRRVTDLAADDETYTDTLLGKLIDDLGFEAAAAQVWTEKAAKYSGLVDMTESGSTRRLSQLVDHATKMRGVFSATTEEVTTGRSFTVEIERA